MFLGAAAGVAPAFFSISKVFALPVHLSVCLSFFSFTLCHTYSSTSERWGDGHPTTIGGRTMTGLVRTKTMLLPQEQPQPQETAAISAASPPTTTITPIARYLSPTWGGM